jgi:hypothetical protein
MSLMKKSAKSGATIFCQKYYIHNETRKKYTAPNWANSTTFKALLKLEIRPKCGNSPKMRKVAQNAKTRPNGEN